VIAVRSRTAFADRLLNLATRSSTVVRQSLLRHGDAPLSEMLGSLWRRPVEPLQPRDDLWAAVRHHATAHYAPETAQRALDGLRAVPVVPTSNHFGVDTFADSVQGTLLFSLRHGVDGTRPRTVVVLGFGSVSLNNLTYPMGLRLYDPRHGDLSGLPQRLPLFPNRFKHCAVAAVGPFDRQMVGRARRRISRMAATGEATAFCGRAAGQVLDEHFAAPETLALPTYGRQSTHINATLWRRMFREPSIASELVQLQIEPICADLLARDLVNPASLARLVLFVPHTRDAILAGLDGARACWRRDHLEHSLRRPESHLHRPGGTMFFWGLTEQGRRIPLVLEHDQASLRLAGVDARYRRWEWPFTPDGIAAGLDDGHLLPSLFTCFLVLALARGLVCVGGYYQAEYLPVIQERVATALAADSALREVAERVTAVPTDVCVAGVQAIVRVLADGAVIPAGPVEIVGAGGLGEPDLASAQAVTVRDAHLVSFTETFRHLVPTATLPGDWVHRLATDNARLAANIVRLEAP
jgi:hypothetical protein